MLVRGLAAFGLVGVALALPQYPVWRYTVSLEDPPESRYQHVWEDFVARRGTAAFRETYFAWHIWLQGALPDLFGELEASKGAATKWLATLQSSHPGTARQVEALSRVLLAANASEPLFQPESIATLSSVYVLTNTAASNTTDTIPSACTSTLVRQASGQVLHGRSLDYEPRGALAESTVLLDYTSQGEAAYSCLYPLPFPAAFQWFTCVRPGSFSLSVNARSQGRDTEHNATFSELMRRVHTGSLLLGEVAERAMLAPSYEEALTQLASLPVVSSNYFILAGPSGKGAIVTRYGNASSADIWALGSTEADGQPEWMRVQTNVDHWVSFETGAYATHRRQRAVDLLSALGPQQVNKKSLFATYLTDHARKGWQNRTNPEDVGVILRPSTIATVIMDPTQNFDLRYWRVWAADPTIHPPASSLSQTALPREEMIV